MALSDTLLPSLFQSLSRIVLPSIAYLGGHKSVVFRLPSSLSWVALLLTLSSLPSSLPSSSRRSKVARDMSTASWPSRLVPAAIARCPNRLPIVWTVWSTAGLLWTFLLPQNENRLESRKALSSGLSTGNDAQMVARPTSRLINQIGSTSVTAVPSQHGIISVSLGQLTRRSGTSYWWNLGLFLLQHEYKATFGLNL